MTIYADVLGAGRNAFRKRTRRQYTIKWNGVWWFLVYFLVCLQTIWGKIVDNVVQLT